MTGSKARKEDRIRKIANGFAVFRPGEPAVREFASGGSISVGRIRNLVILSAVWLRCQRSLCQGFLRALVPTGGLLGKR